MEHGRQIVTAACHIHIYSYSIFMFVTTLRNTCMSAEKRIAGGNGLPRVLTHCWLTDLLYLLVTSCFVAIALCWACRAVRFLQFVEWTVRIISVFFVSRFHLYVCCFTRCEINWTNGVKIRMEALGERKPPPRPLMCVVWLATWSR